MPKCGHTFHLSCIDLWLKRQSTCPICRLPVQDSTENEPVPSAAHGCESQSFDSTEISVERSLSCLLPASEQSEVHRTSEAPENYVTIEVESRAAEIAPARS
ncbi:hypothetical protein LIER_40044 [Lithospermum erythrorhizon]|uniref:RING-type domain-containing protein n=1 Tax=Lithospermum erythrorhizon TaxID=34254 RepID=A0AAV3QPU8_LITER